MIFLDFETFSTVPIAHGTYKYAENAEIMLATWAVDDGPVQLLDFTERGVLGEYEEFNISRNKKVVLLRTLLTRDPEEIVVAHNAMFDRNVLRLGNLKLDVPISRWRCCMVKALTHGLPGSLGKLCEVVGVRSEDSKHSEGNRLIQLFCKPRPKNMKLRRATWHTHPQEWLEFCEYAISDITAMRAVWKKLPSWNYGEDKVGGLERDLWHLDQRMNDRGIYLDQDLITAAIRATDAEKIRLGHRISDATDEFVTSANQRDKLIEYIFAEHGIGMLDITKSSVGKMLDRDDLPTEVKELLQIRAQASQTSTAKYNAFMRGANSDGRLRGMIQFSGAARTRRDAGRTVQLQNLPSRGLLGDTEVEQGIHALKVGSEDLLYSNIMLLTTSTIRGVITAPPGKKLVVADLSNIEGRGLAWAAGEDWKVQAYRDFDEGIGHDLYNLTYARSFSIDVAKVSKKQRSIGKVMELGLGYEGGINAFVTFAAVYGIDLEEMAHTAWDSLPEDDITESVSFVGWLQKKGTTWPMSEDAVVVCNAFKVAWRRAHPKVVQLWDEMGIGFRQATNNPGVNFHYRQFVFRRDGAWLRIKLPSGRCLVYPHPEVSDKGQCSYMGVNQYTRKWQRILTYGGKLTENAIQSVSRDFMFYPLSMLDKAGYDLVLRVHDEVVTEVPDTPDFSLAGLVGIVTTVPPWGGGMPLAASGFEAYRYRK